MTERELFENEEQILKQAEKFFKGEKKVGAIVKGKYQAEKGLKEDKNGQPKK